MDRSTRRSTLVICATGLVLALGSAAGADSIAPHRNVVSALEGTAPDNAATSHLRANLIRRGSGEWVIADVEMVPVGPSSGTLSTSSTAQVDSRFQQVIDEYEHAFDKRDSQRLARVWMMNPAERAQVNKLFDRASKVSLSVDNARVTHTGDRAVVEFDQVIEIWKGTLRRVRKTMAASDNYGDWDLASGG